MAELRHISSHARTRNQYVSATPSHKYVPKSQIGLSEYVIISGTGSKRKSTTVHATKEQAQKLAAMA